MGNGSSNQKDTTNKGEINPNDIEIEEDPLAKYEEVNVKDINNTDIYYDKEYNGEMKLLGKYTNEKENRSFYQQGDGHIVDLIYKFKNGDEITEFNSSLRNNKLYKLKVVSTPEATSAPVIGVGGGKRKKKTKGGKNKKKRKSKRKGGAILL